MGLFDTKKMLGNMAPMGEIPPQQELLARTVRVAWPAVVESFMVCIVAIIDTMMVGSLGSHAIAAVGLTTQPKFIALTVFLSLNVAVSAVVARRVGERDREDANRVLTFALLLVLGMTAVVSTLGAVFAAPIITLVGGEPATITLATEYLSVILGGLVFSTISLVINAAQRGCGNTKITMTTNLVSNGVNVVFNYLLIGGNYGFPRLGVRGAAIATVLGSICACLMSLRSVSHSGSFLFLWDRKNIGMKPKSLQAIFKIGSSAMLEQIFQRFGFLIYAMTVASLGTTAFAAHQIAINICQLSFSLGEGISFAAVALVGKNLGQKRPDMAKIHGSICQRIGFIFSGGCSVVFLLFGRTLFRMFTTEEGVLFYAPPIMALMCLITFFQIAAVIYAGCLRGAGDTTFIAILSLVSVAIVRPAASWIFCYPLGFGLVGAWMGFCADLTIRFFFTFLRFKSGRWTKIAL